MPTQKFLLVIWFILLPAITLSQPPVKKVLFDNTKSETAGNADWIIDTDQPLPIPDQSTVTQSTAESYWLGAISAWGIDLVKLGYTVHTLTSTYGITYGNTNNPYDLSKYNLFIVCEPQDPFSAAEKTAILNFVNDGGGLLMVADHSGSDRNSNGWDSPQVWNDLGSGTAFGIHFQSTSETNNNITQVATNVSATPGDSIIVGPDGTVTALSYHNGTTMNILTGSNPNAAGHIWMNSIAQGTTQTVAATSRYGNGKVGAVGDSSPADDGSAQPGNSNIFNGWGEAGATDNILFLNMSIWLATPSVIPPPPPQVTLISPNDGSTFVATPTSFTWNSASTATTYGLEISLSNTFSSFVLNDSTLTDTLRSVSSLSLNTTYYWRVRAKNAGGWGSYSTIRSFTTWNTPPQVQLDIPLDADVSVPTPTQLKWHPAQTATTYELDISTSNAFSSFVDHDTTLTDTSEITSVLSLNTTYYWRVRAKNAAGWGPYSTTRSFKTWTTPAQVQLISPANNSSGVSIPVTFVWNAVQGVIVFEIDVSTSNTFGSFVNEDTTVVDTFKSIDSLLLGTKYYWRVRAKNNAGWGQFSQVWNMTTWDFPAQVILISPKDSANVSTNPVLFKWHSSAGAAAYEFDLSTSSLFESFVHSDSTMIDTVKPISGLDTALTYFWRVRAKNGVGWGGYSSIRMMRYSLQQTITANVGNGWNIVSLSVEVSDGRKEIVFPSSTSNAFAYDNVYVVKDTLIPGVGYWLKFSGSQSISMTGFTKTQDTIDVKDGWNLIGALSNPISVHEVGSIPGGMITSPFFGFTTAYYTSDSLLPIKGYWVKVSGNGKLILASSRIVPISRRIHITPTVELPPSPPVRELARSQALPKDFSLEQNYPNPFNPLTVIHYQIPDLGAEHVLPVQVQVYDVFGQVVATLIDEMQDAGFKSVQWNAGTLASGVYIYRLRARTFTDVKKMLLIR